MVAAPAGLKVPLLEEEHSRQGKRGGGGGLRTRAGEEASFLGSIVGAEETDEIVGEPLDAEKLLVVGMRRNFVQVVRCVAPWSPTKTSGCSTSEWRSLSPLTSLPAVLERKDWIRHSIYPDAAGSGRTRPAPFVAADAAAAAQTVVVAVVPSALALAPVVTVGAHGGALAAAAVADGTADHYCRWRRLARSSLRCRRTRTSSRCCCCW